MRVWPLTGETGPLWSHSSSFCPSVLYNIPIPPWCNSRYWIDSTLIAAQQYKCNLIKDPQKRWVCCSNPAACTPTLPDLILSRFLCIKEMNHRWWCKNEKLQLHEPSMIFFFSYQTITAILCQNTVAVAYIPLANIRSHHFWNVPSSFILYGFK